MTPSYAVHYSIDPPRGFSRLQLLVRFAAFCALGLLGLSFGALFMFAYVVLPVFAATRLSARQPAAYLDEDGPRVTAALRWFAAVSAWTGLIADQLPSRTPDEVVHLAIEGRPQPTARTAILRIFTGIPSALVLAVLCWIGAFVWIWAALTILFAERVGPGAFHYLEGLQRWSVRLLAYQASLVDEYPPFSFAETPDSQTSLLRGAR